ncbi:DUF1361 domain-containing protein [Flavobacterium sp.]|uniref:DUF1361 domain-containing protein n=1 Tax=Flavobacterium sp. TaxID=239 RepID=UPI002488BA64|nr:DUF1361 domain-containing protein [Flavobacterium sp.]MDI1317356.1 DUF1361 domain-containing protein [Flavobacterium sp.]
MNQILTIYFFNKKQNSNLILLAFLSLLLILLRVKITHDIYLLFLLWNLILAYLPYMLSSKIKSTMPGTFTFYFFLFGWLLFIPNSFYLITDFVHLHHSNSLQFLFDAVILTCFTVAGFYAGIASLLQIHTLGEMKFSRKKCSYLIIILCYLISFGIYLGRILRFNSWDILSNPVNLLDNIFKSLLRFEAYVFTIVMGTLILLIYGFIYGILNKKIILKSW